MALTVAFRVLGPVELRVAGRAFDLGAPKQRAVLAALAVDAGRPVSIDELVDRVWGEAPPAEAHNALYGHMTRLRRVLVEASAISDAPFRLRRGPGGYTLMVDRDLVDLHRFRRLVDQARLPACSEAGRAALLREALDLWSARPLADVAGGWAARVREAAEQQRFGAAVSWAQAELRQGHADTVIDGVSALLADHPFVEPLAAVLMRALCAAQRSAEALDCYATLRRRLADELGAEPGSELRRLHGAILRGELDRPRPRMAPVAGRDRPIPEQLPLDVPGFTGRGEELARLDALLTEADSRPVAVVVSAIAGTAGVGKTALAVHWAHRARPAFPDGQLYLNLRGFDPTGAATEPADAILVLLFALGMPPQRVPPALDAQIGLYRSLVANRRILVVLDNARDAEQVRPLLPGSPSCLVLVTSRADLTGLVAAEGAHPVILDLLPATDARDLLERRLGRARVAAEPDAVDRIIAACAGLPLALAIASARAATHPSLPLRTLAAELQDARSRLDALASGDRVTDMRAVFACSYHTLSTPATRLFRLLGLHPGPDITMAAAASLGAVPPGQIPSLLAELQGANLIAEHTPGRYAMHDLLRVYATELADELDSGEARHAAVRRILDHYLHTAYAASLLLEPHRDQVSVSPPQPGVIPEVIADHSSALTWFTAERWVLLAALGVAARNGFDIPLWQLASTLNTFLYRRGDWNDVTSTQGAALQAAQRLGDRTWQALAHRSLGRAYALLERHDAAQHHLRLALRLFDELGDRIGQAHAHHNLAWALERQGRLAQALGHSQHALDLYRAARHPVGQARALNAVGWYQALLSDNEPALASCLQALLLHQQLGDRPGEAHTWDSIGYIHRQRGDHHQAVADYRHAVDLYRQLGDRYNEATALTRLGDASNAAGDSAAAHEAWRYAVAILDELGHPDAKQVRAILRGAEPTASRSP